MDPLSRARYKGLSTKADQVPHFPYLLLPQLSPFPTHGVRQPAGLYAEEKKASVFDPPEDPKATKKKKSKSPTRPPPSNQKPLVLATTTTTAGATPSGFYGPQWKAENPIDKTFRATKRPKPLLQLSDGTKLTPERLKERQLGYDAITEAQESLKGEKPPVFRMEFHKPLQLATHKTAKVAGAPGWAPAQVAAAIEAAEREEAELQAEADSEAKQQWEELVSKHQQDHNERREKVASRQPGASRQGGGSSSRTGRSAGSPRSAAAAALTNGADNNQSSLETKQQDDGALSERAALLASFSLRGEEVPEHLLAVAERARSSSPPTDAHPLLPREVIAAETGYLPPAAGASVPPSLVGGSGGSVVSTNGRSAFSSTANSVVAGGAEGGSQTQATLLAPAKSLEDLSAVSGSSAARGATPHIPLSLLTGRNSPPGTASRQPTAAPFQTTLSQEDFAVLKHGLKTYSEEVLAFKRRKNRGNVMREARALRFAAALMRIQKWWREYAARWKAWHNRPQTAPLQVREDAASTIQRAWNEKRTDTLKSYARLRFKEIVTSVSTFLAERTAKRRLDMVTLSKAAVRIQACFRSFLARRVVNALKKHVDRRTKSHEAATKIQAAYRMYVLRRLYRQLLIFNDAATQIQRLYKGFATRKRQARLKELSVIAPEKRAAFLLIDAERKHTTYQQYLKDLLVLQTETNGLKTRVENHAKTVKQLKGKRDRAQKEFEDARNAHSWLEHFADNLPRLEKIAWMMHEDIHMAEKEFRGQLDTNHKWFAAAFGDASLGLTHRVAMTQLLAAVFSGIARKIDSRTAVSSIAKTLALDLRIQLAKHAPEVQNAEVRAIAAARELEGLDEELMAARRAIMAREGEIARRTRNVHFLENEVQELLQEAQESDKQCNVNAGIPLTWKEMVDLNDAPSIRHAAEMKKQAMKALEDKKERDRLLKLGQTPKPMLLLGNNSGRPGDVPPLKFGQLQLENGGVNDNTGRSMGAANGTNRTEGEDEEQLSHFLGKPSKRKRALANRVIPPEVQAHAQKIENQLSAFVKAMALPGISTLAAVRAHRDHQIMLVEASVGFDKTRSAELLGPMRSKGPMGPEQGLAANVRLDMHRKVGEKFINMKKDEIARRQSEEAWRKGQAADRPTIGPSKGGFTDQSTQKKVRTEKNLNRLIRAATWAGIAPKAIQEQMVRAAAASAIKGELSEIGSLRGQADEGELLAAKGEDQGFSGEHKGDGSHLPENFVPEDKTKMVIALKDGDLDFIEPLGIDIPEPGEDLNPRVMRDATISDLPVAHVLLEFEPHIAALAKKRRERAAARIAAGLPPDMDPAEEARLQAEQVSKFAALARKDLENAGLGGSPPASAAPLARLGDARRFPAIPDAQRPLMLEDGSSSPSRTTTAQGAGAGAGEDAPFVISPYGSEQALPGPVPHTAGTVNTLMRPPSLSAKPQTGLSNPSMRPESGAMPDGATALAQSRGAPSEWTDPDAATEYGVMESRAVTASAAAAGLSNAYIEAVSAAEGVQGQQMIPMEQFNDDGKRPLGLHLGFPKRTYRVLDPNGNPIKPKLSQREQQVLATLPPGQTLKDLFPGLGVDDIGMAAGDNGKPEGWDEENGFGGGGGEMVVHGAYNGQGQQLATLGDEDQGRAIVPAHLGAGGAGAGDNGSATSSPSNSPNKGKKKAEKQVPAFVRMMLKALPVQKRIINPMRSVARDFRANFESMAEAKAAAYLERNEDIYEQIPQTALDPAAEYIPPHIQERIAEAERLPFMGPVEAEKAVADDAMRTADIHAYPPDILRYTVEDVCWWVTKIGLLKYRTLFAKASVDGETLMQMRPGDFVGVVGIDDYNDINLILKERETLLKESASASLRKLADPLDYNQREEGLKKRIEQRAPPLIAVFAAARAGRVAAVNDALRYGFELETEDHEGNTLFLVAAMHGHKRLLDLLIGRGCNVNHQNYEGNSALHFCLDPAYRRLADPDGSVAKYLVMHGAHAELLNKYGLEPFQGLRPGTTVGKMRAGRAPVSQTPSTAGRGREEVKIDNGVAAPEGSRRQAQRKEAMEKPNTPFTFTAVDDRKRRSASPDRGRAAQGRAFNGNVPESFPGKPKLFRYPGQEDSAYHSHGDEDEDEEDYQMDQGGGSAFTRPPPRADAAGSESDNDKEGGSRPGSSGSVGAGGRPSTTLSLGRLGDAPPRTPEGGGRVRAGGVLASAGRSMLAGTTPSAGAGAAAAAVAAASVDEAGIPPRGILASGGSSRRRAAGESGGNGGGAVGGGGGSSRPGTVTFAPGAGGFE